MGESSNQHPGPLEAELATFRPQPMSPALASRIEATLDESRPLWRIGAGLLTVAAAACVMIGLALPWSRDHRGGTDYVNTGTRPSAPLRGNALRAASPPSLVDYQQAFAESSDAFDALLARPAGSGGAPVRAFSFPSPINLNNNTGDSK